MKKSNKLLVAGFLTVVVLISAIHITLYAKYKAGDYTIYQANEETTTRPMQTFPNILFVSVQNVPGAIVRFSDVAKVAKEEENIQYSQKGDTLLITGNGPGGEDGMPHPVVFHLPYGATFILRQSSLSFEGSKTTVNNNPVVYLEKSKLLFSGAGTPLRMGTVKVVASDSSVVSFTGNTQVNHLDVQLWNSSFKYTEGNVGQLSVETDSLSHISLPSKHLIKATIKNINAQ